MSLYRYVLSPNSARWKKAAVERRPRNGTAHARGDEAGGDGAFEALKCSRKVPRFVAVGAQDRGGFVAWAEAAAHRKRPGRGSAVCSVSSGPEERGHGGPEGPIQPGGSDEHRGAEGKGDQHREQRRVPSLPHGRLQDIQQEQLRGG